MTRLLVVDFDFFFPVRTGPSDPQWPLYDWGHQEAPFWIDGPLWPGRAAAFLANGLPLPGLSGEERAFWPRFSFAPGAALYLADSNSYGAHPDVQEDVHEVWLYDAHHDSGYHVRPEITGRTLKVRLRRYAESARWYCDDWMILHHLCGAELHVRYPAWKHWAFEAEPEAILPDRVLDRRIDGPDNGPRGALDRVLVCRSGAWVPPWHDRAFGAFVRAAPRMLARHELQPCLQRRAFDLAACEHAAEKLRQAQARFAGAR